MALIPEQIALLITASTALLTLLLLLSRGLRHTFPALLALILAEVLQDVILARAVISPKNYFRCWIATQAVNLLLQIWVMRELLGILVQQFKNIRALTERSVGWFFLASLFVAGAVAWFGHAAQQQSGDLSASVYQTRWALAYAGLTIAIVECFIVVFLLCAAGYFLYFPVQISRNAVFYYVTFVALGLGYLGGLLFAGSTTLQKHRDVFNTLLFFSSLSAYALLAFCLRRSADDTLVQPRHTDPATQRRLLEQLQQIDNLLAHTATRLEL